RIQSRQQTNGYDVDYEGTLAQDGRSIQGTLTVLGPGGIYDWKATIESAAASPPADNINIPPDQALLGRVWRVTEYGGWTATWTRRGGSSVFDGVWFNGSQKVTGVLAMAVQGRVVRIQSRQQTNGYDVDYEGTLAQDGRSIQGTLTVLGPGGIYDWKATIESFSDLIILTNHMARRSKIIIRTIIAAKETLARREESFLEPDFVWNGWRLKRSLMPGLSF
ncbi:MAG: hypothetical protein NTW95_14360, partial [Candidatus Aminicenantes bacterium]|nr:hypothetical protein [Candidatus Aminicenantes bacterium]